MPLPADSPDVEPSDDPRVPRRTPVGPDDVPGEADVDKAENDEDSEDETSA